MPLKNYTTEVSALKSIGEIQGNLVAHGATAVMKDSQTLYELIASRGFLLTEGR